MSKTNEGLAKVLREHRRCRSVGGGLAYKCICGEAVASNSHHVMSKHQAEKALEFLADEEVTAEDLLETVEGLSVANASFNEGMGAGVAACTESAEGEPFVKPVSPYAAALLALIEADKENLDHSPCCSSHGVPMTCERYRRTHFVEVRPCCSTDRARMELEKAAGA